MTTPSKTPITDAVIDEVNEQHAREGTDQLSHYYKLVEVLSKHSRRIEEVAQGMRSAFSDLLHQIENPSIDSGPAAFVYEAMMCEAAVAKLKTALARFDALKEDLK